MKVDVEYSKFFETRKRAQTGESFIALTEDAPEELKQLVRDIHGRFGSMPNDWIYKVILEAFEDMEDVQDLDSCVIEADCYRWELIDWLQNHYAIQFIEEARETEGSDSSFEGMIQNGQTHAKYTIYQAVYIFLDNH